MIGFLLNFLLVFTIIGVCTTFLGYAVHWVFHQPWSLWFYNAHMDHHTVQYPITDFFSDEYRSAGRNSTVILFIVAFAPLLVVLGLLTFLGVLSLTTGLTSLAWLAVWGLLHNYIHDQFHLTNTFWNKFPLFIKWKKLHYIHHLDMRTNFGIVFFDWDKVFKTFIDEDIELH